MPSVGRLVLAVPVCSLCGQCGRRGHRVASRGPRLLCVLAYSVAGGVTFPTFLGETPIKITSILDGLRMREAYFNAKRTRAPGPNGRGWLDALDKVAGLFFWSDGGLIAKDRSLRMVGMQAVQVCEASLASMFSKVRRGVQVSIHAMRLDMLHCAVCLLATEDGGHLSRPEGVVRSCEGVRRGCSGRLRHPGRAEHHLWAPARGHVYR